MKLTTHTIYAETIVKCRKRYVEWYAENKVYLIRCDYIQCLDGGWSLVIKYMV